MSALDTARAIREQGGLVYVPHPMDPFRHGLKDAGLREVAPLTDVVEVFNARCVRGDSNRLALEAADSLGLAQAAASDSHSPGEIGRSYVEGPDFDDPQGLLRMLRAGKMVCRLSPKRVHLYSRLAALRRLSQGGRRG
jgi:predicted metal-dependent phosphoesterase TrpH